MNITFEELVKSIRIVGVMADCFEINLMPDIDDNSQFIPDIPKKSFERLACVSQLFEEKYPGMLHPEISGWIYKKALQEEK